MAANHELKIKEGATYNLKIFRNAPRLDVNGVPVRDVNRQVIYDPVNMTGWSGHMQIRQDFSGQVIVDITENNSGADGFLTFGNGFWTIKILEPKTHLIKSNQIFDVFAWPFGGEHSKILKGTVVLEPAVTS